MAAAAALMMGASAFAQKPNLSREPFVISVGKLSEYLQLTSTQIEEVANINEYFIEKQAESARSGSKNHDRKQYEAVYGNLKLMKSNNISKGCLYRSAEIGLCRNGRRGSI